MERRKNYFIKKEFQFGFLIKFITLLIIESLLIFALLMIISNNTLTTGYQHSILTIEKTQSYFLIPMILIILIVVIGVGLVGMIIFTLFSHRIAGPLYRFETVLKEIKAGELRGRVHLRNSDELVVLQDALNEFKQSLNSRMTNIKSGLNEIEQMLKKEPDSTMLAELQKKIQLVKNEIEHFKVASDTEKGK